MGKGSPAGQGQTHEVRLVDGCFGRGVYVRVRKMETEALKGQIWQVPYAIFGGILVLEGQDCFSGYLGNYFSDYFRTTFRTMHNNIGV